MDAYLEIGILYFDWDNTIQHGSKQEIITLHYRYVHVLMYSCTCACTLYAYTVLYGLLNTEEKAESNRRKGRVVACTVLL